MGGPGFSVQERTWTRPTLDVHGMSGRFNGVGTKTVIPAKAVVKGNMRLVPDMTLSHEHLRSLMIGDDDNCEVGALNIFPDYWDTAPRCYSLRCSPQSRKVRRLRLAQREDPPRYDFVGHNRDV
jgi:hypothetical protein